MELGGGVGADIDSLALGVAEVGDDAEDVVDAVVGEAEAAAGEVGIAAALRFGGFFQHGDIGAVFPR